MVRNGRHENILVTGAHLVISSLSVTHDVTSRTSCGQPIGDYAGFEFTGGAHHVTLTGSRATAEMAGARLEASSSHIRLLHNQFVGNGVLQSLAKGQELGAWGVLVDSAHNEVAWNLFRGNRSTCRMSNGNFSSNSVELFGAVDNAIHHNMSFGDRDFSELGSPPDRTSRDNTYSYNLFVTSLPVSHFIITRGSKDTTFGPVTGTKLQHNTTYQTGRGSQGVVCGGGCGPDLLTMRANIVWAQAKVLYADGAVRPSHNILWSSDGKPRVQMERRNADGSLTRFHLPSSNREVSPRFLGAASGSGELSAGSPAVAQDSATPEFTRDVTGARLRRTGPHDLGAIERATGRG
jgi:hypothetical protein